MLSVFPDLLLFGIVAPTILRIAAGIFFIMLAVHHTRAKDAISSTSFPIVGVMGSAAVWISVVADIALGALLLIGLFTQVAALLGFLAAMKLAILRRRYPMVAPHGRVAYFLLAAICLSLMLTGAGFYAFDLPL